MLLGFVTESKYFWEFPGGPVVQTPSPFTAVARGSIPGQGNKIPQATQCGQNRGGGSDYFCTDEMKFLWFSVSYLTNYFIQKDNTY